MRKSVSAMGCGYSLAYMGQISFCKQVLKIMPSRGEEYAQFTLVKWTSAHVWISIISASVPQINRLDAVMPQPFSTKLIMPSKVDKSGMMKNMALNLKSETKHLFLIVVTPWIE